MSTLKNTIENLAAEFASSIINALRSAPIDELAGYAGTRRSAPAAAPAPAPAAARKADRPAATGRGPGRPKKAAAPAPAAAPAAAAPKKRGRPAAAAKKPAAAKPAPSNKPGRLSRRSLADIGAVLDDIVSLLGQHPEGLRAEQIRVALGLQAKELPRPLADGLDAGRLTKIGQKRATTYFAGGKGKKRK